MSLEEALAANTAAIEKQNSLLEKMFANAGKAAGAAASTTAAAATGKAGGAKPSTKPKVLSVEDIRNTFGGYMSGAKDKDDKAVRKANVAAIIAHFGVDKATDLAEENRDEAVGYIKQFEAGETPDFMNEAGAGDDDDGGSMI